MKEKLKNMAFYLDVAAYYRPVMWARVQNLEREVEQSDRKEEILQVLTEIEESFDYEALVSIFDRPTMNRESWDLERVMCEDDDSEDHEDVILVSKEIRKGIRKILNILDEERKCRRNAVQKRTFNAESSSS